MLLSQIQAIRSKLSGGTLDGREYEILADNLMRVKINHPPDTNYRIKWDDTNEWVVVEKIMKNNFGYNELVNVIPYEMIQNLILYDLTPTEKNNFFT